MNPESIRRVLPVIALVSLALALMAHGAPTRASAASSKKATLGTFHGTWFGHTRSLKIFSNGRAKESIGSGCCDPIVDLKLRLSKPRGTVHNASIRARVTAVDVHDESAYSDAYPAPHVGQVRRLKLKNGVITEPITGTVYCNTAAGNKGKCGA